MVCHSLKKSQVFILQMFISYLDNFLFIQQNGSKKTHTKNKNKVLHSCSVGVIVFLLGPRHLED